jgi:hypothetical protein
MPARNQQPPAAITRWRHPIVAARRATAVVSKHAPRLDTTTGTQTITRPDDSGPKPDNPYGLGRRGSNSWILGHRL